MAPRHPRSRRRARGKPGERFIAHRVRDCLLGRRTLETVRELRAKDVDRALVGSDELPVGRCVSAVLVNGRVLDKEMRVPEVERTVLGQLVLAANRQPQAIVVGQPCGAVGVVYGCLVIREAHLRRPGIVIAMDRTNPDTPGVLEVLGGSGQSSAGAQVYFYVFDFRPTGP